MVRPDPWIAGEHFVEAPLDDLPDLICEMLRDHRRREQIAAALAQHHTMELSARSLVGLIESAEAHPSCARGVATIGPTGKQASL